MNGKSMFSMNKVVLLRENDVETKENSSDNRRKFSCELHTKKYFTKIYELQWIDHFYLEFKR